jgi:hypothetical protein
MMVEGFYGQQEDTVDMVAVGNSHVYRYWQSAFAWKENGIATTAWSTSDMPCGAVKNVITEILKTQNPKLLLLDATVFNNTNDNPSNKIYLLTGNMKYSYNYYGMIHNFCKFADVSKTDSLAYYLPVVQFHSRWCELSSADFEQTQTSYLNSCYQEDFLTTTFEDGEHIYTEETRKISTGSEAALKDLLEYLQEQDVQVLFYVAPVLRGNKYLERANYIGSIIEEYGFDFVDFNDAEYFDEFGFDINTDFQDNNHTNIKGSYKFTKYLSNYLIENYGFEDHRNDSAYASWNDEAEAYYDIVGEYLNQ